MLNRFKLGYHTIEKTKNICCSRNFVYVVRTYQARAGRPKTMDSKAVFQTIEANPVSSTLRVSSKLSISQYSMWFVTLTTSGKASRATELYFMFSNYYKTFDSP